MNSDKNTLILKSLGEVIHRLRKEKALTQEELGKMTGTSQMTVKRLESATVGTRIDNLVSITDALGLKLTDLFAEIEGSTDIHLSDDSQWAQVQKKVNEMTLTEREWIAKVIEDVVQNPWRS